MKSTPDNDAKALVREMDDRLVERASGTFSSSELGRQNQYTVLRDAAPAAGLDPDRVVAMWRAASGAAHGRAWPALSLQHVVPLAEYESGQFRTLRIPDATKMTEALEMADKFTKYGGVRHAHACGANVPALFREASKPVADVRSGTAGGR